VSRTSAFYMALVATAAMAVGFYGARGLGARGDVKSFKNRIPPAKRARNHNLFIAYSLIIIGLLVLYRVLTWRHR
jgi:hypothetical protein